ncbi:MAG: hypothetical protein ABFR90_01825 [Planctomycetota bacterium]
MTFNHSALRWMFFVLATGLICRPVIAKNGEPQKGQNKAETIREESDDIWGGVSFEPAKDQQLTEKQIQQVLNTLKKTNPQKAAQLEKLKNTDAEKFIAAIREEMQKQSGKSEKPTPEKWEDKLHKKHENFLVWFKKQYPEDHKELIELQQANPEKFVQQVIDLMKIYGPIQRTARSSPKLAKAMKKNLDLQKRRDALLLQIRVASEDQRKELVKELNVVISQRFDTIVLEKKIQNDALRARLNGLQKKLDARARELETLKKNKDQSVQNRIDELIEQPEKVNWN